MKPRRSLQLMTILIPFLAAGILSTNSKGLATEAHGTGGCSSITLENAAMMLDVPIDDLQRSSRDIMVSPDDIRKKTFKIEPYNCTIRSKSNFLKGISYITYVYNDAEQARIDFNKMKKGYGTISKVDAVPDIGDETFWAGDNRFQRLVSIKGDAVIDVLGPKDFSLQKQILRLVLDKF